jgi:hypothetical protein
MEETETGNVAGMEETETGNVAGMEETEIAYGNLARKPLLKRPLRR